MHYSSIIIIGFVFLGTIIQINCLQCYKCSCSVNVGETTCKDDSELQCVIEYVENNYCTIARTSSSSITFDHRPNSDLIFLESLHYLRAKEQIIYLESSSSWHAPIVKEFTYGCDWNLCNTPRILSLLPKGLTFTVDSNLLTNSLILQPNETFTTCLSCTKCVNSTAVITCAIVPCSGTCEIDDHLDDPVQHNSSCSFQFTSVCLNEKLNTSIQITGTYFMDDKKFQTGEIDVWCKKNNCNDPVHVQTIQRNITFITEINDQLYFRPQATTSKPNTGLLGCYTCHCDHAVGSDDCKILECTIEYQDKSYCEIVRNFKEIPGREFIQLGHVEQTNLPYRHFIHAEEELILYTNLTWHPPSVNFISYICDWELCNDGRLVDKLITSFQFNADSSEIAAYLQSPEPLTYCAECEVCSNFSSFDQCTNATCSSGGRCYIDQYIKHPDYSSCVYAFKAECENFATESNIILTATYNIDDDILDFEEVNVYCSKNGCNHPATVYSLLNLIHDDINLDSLFFIRPITNTTASPIITEPTPSSPTTATTTLTSTITISATTSTNSPASSSSTSATTASTLVTATNAPTSSASTSATTTNVPASPASTSVTNTSTSTTTTPSSSPIMAISRSAAIIIFLIRLFVSLVINN
ncbi:unnamed protein product [Adineta steineri]|uniref:Sodefrin repeats C n=1 Tax=Adineta steineri TaxID=433720 RepID=A0A815NW23_9BILA|nr:unnamed protein product [Adineta steineri]CAF4161218.1 unnamed protein product [Adineta steineri]